MVRSISLAHYAAMEGRDHCWLIKGYVPKPGLLLLLGEAKTGKTTLALQLGLALGQGTPFMGQAAKPSRVLFYQADMSEFILRSVLQGYTKSGVSMDGNIFIPHPEDMVYGLNILQPFAKDYFKQLREQIQPDVVILDVLAELHSSDEQNSIAMKEVVQAILELFHGCTVVLIHHTRKLSPDEVIDPVRASRGTSYLPGRADTIWLIAENRLRIKGRLGAPTELLLKRAPTGLWCPA